MQNNRATIFHSLSELEDIRELLEELPTPEEILALRASDALQERINELLEKNRAIGLTHTEEDLWQSYERVEHLVRIAKAKAYLTIKTA